MGPVVYILGLVILLSLIVLMFLIILVKNWGMRLIIVWECIRIYLLSRLLVIGILLVRLLGMLIVLVSIRLRVSMMILGDVSPFFVDLFF